MSSVSQTNIALVVTAIIAFIGAIYAAAKKLKAREVRLREDESVRESKIQEALLNYTFTVVVRTRKFTKTTFETVLIEAMVSRGLKVMVVGNDDANRMATNFKCENFPSHYINILGSYEATDMDVFFFDMRAFLQSGQIVAAHSFAKYYNRNKLAEDVVSLLADSLPRTASATKQ